jgi:hypothetical protein
MVLGLKKSESKKRTIVNRRRLIQCIFPVVVVTSDSVQLISRPASARPFEKGDEDVNGNETLLV